jgi:hypothetical protein
MISMRGTAAIGSRAFNFASAPLRPSSAWAASAVCQGSRAYATRARKGVRSSSPTSYSGGGLPYLARRMELEAQRELEPFDPFSVALNSISDNPGAHKKVSSSNGAATTCCLPRSAFPLNLIKFWISPLPALPMHRASLHRPRAVAALPDGIDVLIARLPSLRVCRLARSVEARVRARASSAVGVQRVRRRAVAARWHRASRAVRRLSTSASASTASAMPCTSAVRWLIHTGYAVSSWLVTSTDNLLCVCVCADRSRSQVPLRVRGHQPGPAPAVDRLWATEPRGKDHDGHAPAVGSLLQAHQVLREGHQAARWWI